MRHALAIAGLVRPLLTALPLIGLTAAASLRKLDPATARRQMVGKIKELAASIASETRIAEFRSARALC